MSVYTFVSECALAEFLVSYPLGEARGLRGISEGIENSNYFLATEQGEYVLTIFERIPPRDLPYFLDLTDYLYARDIPCPRPIRRRDGKALSQLCGKPAAIIQKLPGKTLTDFAEAHVREVGAMLARLHQAASGFDQRRDNPTGRDWWRTTAEALKGRLSDGEWALLQDELAFQQEWEQHALPWGVIHADLFPDNALYEGARLGGVIDFYYACDGAYLYDLAITANSWCSGEDGLLQEDATAALLAAYEGVRPLSGEERSQWFTALRAAALRFWLSRLNDFHFPREGELTFIKDPGEYERILRARRAGH